MKALFCFTLAAFGLSCGLLFAQPMGVTPADGVPSIPANVAPVLPGPVGPMGEDGPTPATPPKSCYRVTLDDGSTILGEIDGKSEVSLKSKVGDVKIALHDIARIDKAFAEENHVTVTLSNGDRLTGALSMKDIKLKSALGDLTLKSDGMYSLEAGKLFEESNPVTRRSLDGRSVVTVMRKHFRFQPTVQSPSAYVTGPYTPVPSNSGWSAPVISAPPTRVQPGALTPIAPVPAH